MTTGSSKIINIISCFYGPRGQATG
ncbi:MAG: hypothetical protein ACEY3D_00855 [Rickettsia sp.]